MLIVLALLGCTQDAAEPPVATEKPAEPAAKLKTPEKPAPVPTTPPPVQLAEIPAGLKPPATTEKAPDTFQIQWQTTDGTFTTTCHRAWAPQGADRLYYLVNAGYFENIAYFRVIKGFMAQFGLHGDPAVNEAWKEATIDDDPVVQSNTRGYLSFATSGPNSRTTQMFINFGDNQKLDSMDFSPVCLVDGDGMTVVDSLYDGYGEGAPRGRGPRQDFIHKKGNAYLKENFPELSYIEKATVL